MSRQSWCQNVGKRRVGVFLLIFPASGFPQVNRADTINETLGWPVWLSIALSHFSVFREVCYEEGPTRVHAH